MKRALIGAVATTTLALTSTGIASASVAWTIQRVPMPAGTAAGELVGVSCPTATLCMAVGNAGGVAAAERWSGGAWSPGVLPLPAGAAFSTLSGISCPDSGHCIAVGYYRNSFGSDDLLAERWQFGTWKIQKIPAPANGLLLSAVSCTSDTSCTAVGESAVGPADTTLAEHWDGSSWTVQPTPNPAGTTFSFLSGLSCPSATSCTAVGFYINSANAYQNLAEQ